MKRRNWKSIKKKVCNEGSEKVSRRKEEKRGELKSVHGGLWCVGTGKVGSWRKPCPQPDLQGQLQLQPPPQSAQREGVPLFTVRGAGKQ